MKKLYLAQIGRQLFAVDKKHVIGVGICNNDSFKPIKEDGRLYLLLPNSKRAMICDVQTLMTEHDEEVPAKQHYLIVNHNDLTIGLAMNDKGKIITADVTVARPLPPAFTGQSRTVVPGVLVNGMDLIFLLDLQAVLEATAERCLGRRSKR